MASKKTLYDVLEVSPDATFAEVEAAYLRAMDNLESATRGQGAESRELQTKVLKMAFQTLSNEKSRQAYDARLNPRPAFTLVPPLAPPETLSMQAAAVSLKADAASLMAEAAVLKADAISLHVETTPQKLAGLVAKGVRATFTALGAIVTLVFALIFAMIWVSSGSRQAAQEDEKARERVMIQEYYQTHGVRPKSRTELELLEAENRRQAKAKQEASLEQQKEQRKEAEYQRFIEESRRQAERVSEELRRGQEKAARDERYAAEKARMELRMKEEAERRRIENERRRLGLPY